MGPAKRVGSVSFGSPAFDEPIFPDELIDDDSDMPAKRRPWSPDEDDHLRQLVDQYGIKSWAQIATNLRNRNGKQCRERWRNHLRPELNKGDWTEQEDIDIWDHVQEMGTKWAQISEQYMPLRTDNDIKNRWNSIIRKSSHPSGRAWKPNEITLREEAPPPRRPRRPAGPLRPARSPCAHARRLRLGRCSPRRG